MSRRLALRAGSRGLDFAVSLNCLGPCPAMLERLASVDPSAYPDPMGASARDALGRYLDVDADRLLLGNGASELLWTLAQVLGSEAGSGPALIFEPGFAEARRAAARFGASPVSIRMDDPSDFDVSRFLAVLERERPSFVYLAHPTSPSGRAWELGTIRTILEASRRVPCIVDESFLSLSKAHRDRDVRLPEHAIRVRSLGKELGLAGVRAAYAIVPPGLAGRVRSARPPWSVNSYALSVVEGLGESEPWVSDCRRALLTLTQILAAKLVAVGLGLERTETIYGVVRVGDAARAAEKLLLDHDIAVRDCTSFGMPEHIRVCARPELDSYRLAHALREVRS